MACAARLLPVLLLDQFVNFDGDKKCRLANRQPADPAYAKEQTNALHERKHAVNERSFGGQNYLLFGELADLLGEINPKPPFWIDPQMVQEILVLFRQIPIRTRVQDHR